MPSRSETESPTTPFELLAQSHCPEFFNQPLINCYIMIVHNATAIY
jgi:hypothetical protein